MTKLEKVQEFWIFFQGAVCKSGKTNQAVSYIKTHSLDKKDIFFISCADMKKKKKQLPKKNASLVRCQDVVVQHVQSETRIVQIASLVEQIPWEVSSVRVKKLWTIKSLNSAVKWFHKISIIQKKKKSFNLFKRNTCSKNNSRPVFKCCVTQPGK